jgi:hypothetical protein
MGTLDSDPVTARLLGALTLTSNPSPGSIQKHEDVAQPLSGGAGEAPPAVQVWLTQS